jgi:hypothetical protein
LKKIEDQEIDQHEGSYEVGMLLKKIYVDSALKKANKLNENAKVEFAIPPLPVAGVVTSISSYSGKFV